MADKSPSTPSIYCPACRKFYSFYSSSFITVPSVRMADDTAVAFDPACYGETVDFTRYEGAALPPNKLLHRFPKAKAGGRNERDAVNVYEAEIEQKKRTVQATKAAQKKE